MKARKIAIRPATVADVLQLRDLSRSTFYETYAGQNTSDDMRLYMQQHFSIERLSSELEDAGNAFFIAMLGDEMIGYAKLRTNKPFTLNPSQRGIELERIYVSKAHQGLKTGGALMSSCIQLAEERGYDVMWLGVWEENKAAIAFYEKSGFVIKGKQTFTLGTDPQNDFVMVLQIR